jgi:TRAP-type C4-dicarboxylate transport system permease large subunit
MGEIVPPSNAILVLGAIIMLSMGILFIAGIILTSVIGLCVMALIYFPILAAERPACATGQR